MISTTTAVGIYAIGLVIAATILCGCILNQIVDTIIAIRQSRNKK